MSKAEQDKMSESHQEKRKTRPAVSGNGEKRSVMEGEKRSPNLFVGIPAYNEEVGIGSVVLSALRQTDEVLVVDDGSSDATAEIARDAGARVISHEENRGKGAAIRTILSEARGREFDALVLIDGDGQHIAADIPSVAEPVLGGGSDIAIGSRYLDGKDDETPFYRRVGQKTLDLLTVGSSGASLTDTQSGFRALSPEAAEKLTLRTDGLGVESEMIDEATTNGLDIEEVQIDVRYKEVESPARNPFHHGFAVMVFILRLIRDRHPMMFFGLPGILMLLFGGGLAFHSVYVYQSSATFYQWRLLGGGFMTLLGMTALFSGLVLSQIANMMSKVND